MTFLWLCVFGVPKHDRAWQRWLKLQRIVDISPRTWLLDAWLWCKPQEGMPCLLVLTNSLLDICFGPWAWYVFYCKAVNIFANTITNDPKCSANQMLYGWEWMAQFLKCYRCVPACRFVWLHDDISCFTLSYQATSKHRTQKVTWNHKKLLMSKTSKTTKMTTTLT